MIALSGLAEINFLFFVDNVTIINYTLDILERG